MVQTVTPPSGNQEQTDSGRADQTWVGSSDLGLRPSLHPDATTCWAFQSTSGSLSFFVKWRHSWYPACGAVRGPCEMMPGEDHVPRTSRSVPSFASQLRSHLCFGKECSSEKLSDFPTVTQQVCSLSPVLFCIEAASPPRWGPGPSLGAFSVLNWTVLNVCCEENPI